MPQSDIGAFAAAFGDSFSQTHNRNIQRQMQVKAQQDLEIADVLVKSVFDNPDLANDPEVMKFMNAKLGKNNAQGIASVAAAFNNSPMGILKRSFGAATDVPQGVSMEANGPGTGPSMAPAEILNTGNDAQKQQLRSNLRQTMDTKSGLEVALGYGSQEGHIHQKGREETLTKPMSENQRLEHERKKAKDAATIRIQDARLGLAQKDTELKELRFQETKRRNGVLDNATAQRLRNESTKIELANERLDQSQKHWEADHKLRAQGEAGRDSFRKYLTRMGKEVDGIVEINGLEVPVKKRRYSPDGGQTIVEEIVTTKKKSAPASAVERMAAINSALRIEDELEADFTRHRDDLVNIFAPFAGRTLGDLQQRMGSLSPVQQRFVQKLANLREQRAFINGGKALTETELRMIDSTLPNANVMIESFPAILQASRETLTSFGADMENGFGQVGIIAPKTYRSNSNMGYYDSIKRSAPRLDMSPQVVWSAAEDGPLEMEGGPAGPTTSGDPDADAVNAAFMGTGQ